MIKEKAYAKINISLKVTGTLPSGMHSLKSIMAPIDLYDELTFEKLDNDDIIVEGLDYKDNSIYKAAVAFKEKYHIGGVKIKVFKNIPTAAGLGGGSADSSATLRGLNRLFELNKSLDELKELSDILGSDNSFCLYNKAAICTGRGEQLEFLDFPFEFNVTLVKPNINILTKDIFNNLEKVEVVDKSEELVKALKGQDIRAIDDLIFNELMPSAFKLSPELASLSNELSSNYKVHMSGSGSTLFLINDNSKALINLKNKYKDIFIEKHCVRNTLS